jgi:hypothetical protein
MATQLSVYQGALRLLGPHELATLTDDRPERYQLDNAWTDAVAYMLLQGLWNFAIRTITVTESGTPIAGWDYAFTKPSDYVRTVGKWYANVDTLYVRHVSNHASYGLNITGWPLSFTKALEAYLAFEAGLGVAGDKSNRNDLYQLFEKRLKRAKIIDAFDESVKTSPPGRLVRARVTGLDRKGGGL